MHIQSAYRHFLVINDDQGINFFLFHNLHGLRGKNILRNNRALRRHYLADSGVLNIKIFRQCTPQITIGKNADHPVTGINYSGHAQFFLGHFQ